MEENTLLWQQQRWWCSLKGSFTTGKKKTSTLSVKKEIAWNLQALFSTGQFPTVLIGSVAEIFGHYQHCFLWFSVCTLTILPTTYSHGFENAVWTQAAAYRVGVVCVAQRG